MCELAVGIFALPASKGSTHGLRKISRHAAASASCGRIVPTVAGTDAATARSSSNLVERAALPESGQSGMKRHDKNLRKLK